MFFVLVDISLVKALWLGLGTITTRLRLENIIICPKMCVSVEMI